MVTTAHTVTYTHVLLCVLEAFWILGAGPVLGVAAASGGRRGRAHTGLTRREETRDSQIEPCQTHTNQSQMNSFLWVLRRDPPSFFFGTIHVPHSRVWSHIPQNTIEAFYRADHVYFELDLTDPYTISSLANCQLLPRGERLSDVIPRSLYQRLRQHLDYVRVMMPTWVTAEQRNRGLYADYLFNAITGNWERKRPVWVMLMVNSLTRDDIRSRGTPVLDLYLAQEAQRLEKRTGAVEEVEEQCVPLNGLNFSQVLFALNQTLYQHERIRAASEPTVAYSTDELIRHYNCGDLDSVLFSHDTAQVPNLVNTSLSPQHLSMAQEIDSYFRDELIYKRNRRMANRIHDLLQQHPDRSFFFAFGAGHFLGNNTVLDSLIDKGYDVYHSAAGEELDLGERHRRRRKKYPPLMADIEAGNVNSGLEYLDPFFDTRTRPRHRHGCNDGRGPVVGGSGRRRSRIRCPDTSPTDSSRLKYPQFNDLWVRLEASSFGPDSIFGSPAEPTKPQPVYAMYNNATWRISTTVSLVLWWTCLASMFFR